jgi:DNA helicase-2/ATP-dependent DNA helicase PcrA
MPTPERPEYVNPLQWQAIKHDQGHLLIIAGPGTGKTYTLTHRINYLLPKLPHGKKVLAITFTKKAAEEMRQRLIAQNASVEKSATSGTFHQCCLEILRTYTEKTGLPQNFQVASPEQVADISQQLWPSLSAKERKMKLAAISQWKASAFDEEMPSEAQLFNRVLRENALLDFDDLLLETLTLLRNDTEVLKALQDQYVHIFVDEYQDINAVQHALLKILVGAHNTITAIGDPNQAIYGFRGSDVKFFQRFADDFPGVTTLSLSDNYRSAQNILSASGQVMANTSHARVPALTAQIYSQGRLRIHAAATDKAEAEYVTHQIEKMVGGTSLFSYDSARVESHAEHQRSLGDIAVFYRLKSQVVALQKALDRSGIPYQISGREASDNAEEMIDALYRGQPDEPDISVEKVSLMTLHASKGLEFPVVFIIGCEQNILPLAIGTLISDIDEERRLFYVGMTRAKEELFLVCARQRFLYGQKYQNEPSVFLSDIEAGLKEYEQSIQRLKRPKKGDAQLTLFK